MSDIFARNSAKAGFLRRESRFWPKVPFI